MLDKSGIYVPKEVLKQYGLFIVKNGYISGNGGDCYLMDINNMLIISCTFIKLPQAESSLRDERFHYAIFKASNAIIEAVRGSEDLINKGVKILDSSGGVIFPVEQKNENKNSCWLF